MLNEEAPELELALVKPLLPCISYRKVVSALVNAQHVAFSTITPVMSPQDALRWEAMGG